MRNRMAGRRGRATVAWAMTLSLVPVPGLPQDGGRGFPVTLDLPLSSSWPGRPQYEFGYFPGLTVPGTDPTSGGGIADDAPSRFDPIDPFVNVPGYAEYVQEVIDGLAQAPPPAEVQNAGLEGIEAPSQDGPPVVPTPPPGTASAPSAPLSRSWEKEKTFNALDADDYTRAGAVEEAIFLDPNTTETLSDYDVEETDDRVVYTRRDGARRFVGREDGKKIVVEVYRAAPGGAGAAAAEPPPAFGPAEMVQLDQAAKEKEASRIAANKGLVDAAVAEGRTLAGDLKIHDVAVSSYTVGGLVIVRDLYVRQLTELVSGLSSLSSRPQDARDAYIRQLAQAETREIFLQQLLSGAASRLILDQLLELERNGHAEDAAWVRGLVALPDAARREEVRRQLFELYDEFPLLVEPLGVGPAGLKESALPELRVRFASRIREAIDGAHAEINRVRGFTTRQELGEFGDAQYARVRETAAALYGPRVQQLIGEVALIGEAGRRKEEVTRATFAVVVGSIGLVTALAAPLAGLVAAEVATAETAAVVAATTQVAATGAGVGLAAGQLAFDGYQFYTVTTKLDRARKGVSVLGRGTVDQLTQEQTDGFLALAIDAPVLVLSGFGARTSLKDAATALDAAAEARAAAAAGRATAVGIDVVPASLPAVQRGAAKARELGIASRDVDTALRIAGAGNGATNREAAKQLAQLAQIDDLRTTALAAGVPYKEVSALFDKAAKAGTLSAYGDLATDLFRATANKKGLTFVLDVPYKGVVDGEKLNDVAGTLFQRFFRGVLPERWLQTNLVKLLEIKGKLTFLAQGRLARFTRDEIAALQSLLRRPDATKLYGFAPREGSFVRIFDEEAIATARRLFGAANRAEVAAGRASLTAAAAPPAAGARTAANARAAANAPMAAGARTAAAAPAAGATGAIVREIGAAEGKQILARIDDAALAATAVERAGLPGDAAFFSKQGLVPRRTVEIGGQRFHLTSAFEGPDGRRAIIAFQETAGGKVVPRTFYLSNEHGVWRVATGARPDLIHKGPIRYFYGGRAIPRAEYDQLVMAGKNPFFQFVNESAVDLAAGLQGVVGRLANEKPILTLSPANAERAFFGHLERPYVGESPREFGAMVTVADVERPLSEASLAAGAAPDFARGPVDSWRFLHPEYKNVEAFVYRSKDGTIEYVVLRDGQGRVFVPSIQDARGAVTPFGPRAQAIQTDLSQVPLQQASKGYEANPAFKRNDFIRGFEQNLPPPASSLAAGGPGAAVADELAREILGRIGRGGVAPGVLLRSYKAAMDRAGVRDDDLRRAIERERARRAGDTKPPRRVSAAPPKAARRVSLAALAGAPASSPPAGIQIAIVSLGKSSGDGFQVQVVNDSPVTVTIDEGTVVLEPVKGVAAPLPASAGHAVTGMLEAYCLEFQRPVPSPGMHYRPAPPAVQDAFERLSPLLEAGRSRRDGGRFNPDSNPKSYGEFIVQYSLWTALEGWDEREFTDVFLKKTKENLEGAGRRWDGSVEKLLRAAAPGRWRDIAATLEEANRTNAR